MKNNNTSTNLKKNKVAILVFNNFLFDSRVLREAISLKKGGYDVKVIAFHEEGLPEFEYKEEIPVYRIGLKSRSWSKGYIVQIIKWIELFYRIIKNHRDADIYHICDVLPLPVGILIKKIFNKNAKVVYDAHELEFDKDTDRVLFGKILRKIEQRYIRQVDARITVTDLIADLYAKEYNIAPPKVLMNCPYLKPVKSNNAFRQKFNIRADQIIVLYQGLMKPGRGIEQLISAFQNMQDDKYVLVLLGYGVLEKEIIETCNNTPTVFFHPGVPPTELLEYTASADIGAYVIQNTNRSYYYSLGNKLFEYIMCGLPIISTNLPSPKKIIGNDLGVILDQDDPNNIKNALDKIVANGLESYRPKLEEAAKIYNWETQEKILLDVYKNLYES